MISSSQFTSFLHTESDAEQRTLAQAVLGRDNLKHTHRAQLGIANNALLDKPLLSSSKHVGYVIAQDAEKTYLRTQDPKPDGQEHVLAYPKAVFSEGLPPVAPDARVVIETRNGRVAATPARTVDRASLEPVQLPARTPASQMPNRGRTPTNCMIM